MDGGRAQDNTGLMLVKYKCFEGCSISNKVKGGGGEGGELCYVTRGTE